MYKKWTYKKWNYKNERIKNEHMKNELIKKRTDPDEGGSGLDPIYEHRGTI